MLLNKIYEALRIDNILKNNHSITYKKAEEITVIFSY